MDGPRERERDSGLSPDKKSAHAHFCPPPPSFSPITRIMDRPQTPFGLADPRFKGVSETIQANFEKKDIGPIRKGNARNQYSSDTVPNLPIAQAYMDMDTIPGSQH